MFLALLYKANIAMVKDIFLFYNQEQSQLQSELLNIESQCAMLSEGIKERQQRIKESQRKIDKVMSSIFITKWLVASF